jgi:pectate lyase
MQNNFVGFLTNVKLNMMQVMLLGHSDSYVKDKAMQVTIAFNHFGEGLIQRMPR